VGISLCTLKLRVTVINAIDCIIRDCLWRAVIVKMHTETLWTKCAAAGMDMVLGYPQFEDSEHNGTLA
jgi:hypothetical protein